MHQRDGFPAGVPAWIDRVASEPRSLADFYGGLFGWTFDEVGAPGDDSYLVALHEGRRAAAIGAPRAGSPSDSWTTYVACDDVEGSAERVRKAGGRIEAGPEPLHGVASVTRCVDPAGAAFGLWQPGSIRGAEIVNVPGAWNFSELHTSDPSGAAEFYGAVFGWEVDEVDMGGYAGTMVRLPGYADFLEQFDPGIRKRHADFGAPPGFSECVAWILPPDDGDATPRWTLTFTVAETDVVADRARELGATVEVEPHDIGPVRSAMIRDPGGAAFAANSFNPG